MTRFFITNAGLAAALKDAQVHIELNAILQGTATKKQIEHHQAAGYIETDRRPIPVDNNAVIASGVVERLREALSEDGDRPKPASKAPTPVEDDAPIDLRTVPKKVYRLKSDKPPLTEAQLRGLPSGARRIYTALRRIEISTTKALAEAVGLNRRTVENSLGALRKAGVLEDFDFQR